MAGTGGNQGGNSRFRKKIIFCKKGLHFVFGYDIISKRSKDRPQTRGISSAGRALHWQCRGQRFDPAMLHQSPLKFVSEGFFLYLEPCKAAFPFVIGKLLCLSSGLFGFLTKQTAKRRCPTSAPQNQSAPIYCPGKRTPEAPAGTASPGTAAPAAHEAAGFLHPSG